MFIYTGLYILDLPKSIAKHVSDISSNEYVFTESVPIYQEAFKNSGFPETLTYIMNKNGIDNNLIETKRCKRKIIWFSPSYSMNVKTNAGKIFLEIGELKEILYIKHLTKIPLKLAI